MSEVAHTEEGKIAQRSTLAVPSFMALYILSNPVLTDFQPRYPEVRTIQTESTSSLADMNFEPVDFEASIHTQLKRIHSELVERAETVPEDIQEVIASNFWDLIEM